MRRDDMGWDEMRPLCCRVASAPQAAHRARTAAAGTGSSSRSSCVSTSFRTRCRLLLTLNRPPPPQPQRTSKRRGASLAPPPPPPPPSHSPHASPFRAKRSGPSTTIHAQRGGARVGVALVERLVGGGGVLPSQTPQGDTRSDLTDARARPPLTGAVHPLRRPAVGRVPLRGRLPPVQSGHVSSIPPY